LKIPAELLKESERKSLGNSMGIAVRKLGLIAKVCATDSVAVNSQSWNFSSFIIRPMWRCCAIAKAANKWPTTWKWTITVTNTGPALRTPKARRMLRGCRRGNQVLIFLCEADLPLEPWRLPLHPATGRVRWQEHTNESAPDSLSSRETLVDQPSPEGLLTTVSSIRYERADRAFRHLALGITVH
jgi:hypothetical protein